MEQPSFTRKIILEELVRRFGSGAGDVRPLLDGARAAVVHGEKVAVFSVEKRDII